MYCFFSGVIDSSILSKFYIPDKDEFMVLASDGIWNVKKCQEVIDFLRPKIATCEGKLSTVIEEVS